MINFMDNRMSLDSLPKSEDFLWLWQVLLLQVVSAPIAILLVILLTQAYLSFPIR